MTSHSMVYQKIHLERLRFRFVDFLAVASHFAEEEGTCLLLSGGGFDSAENSFLCLFPVETVVVDRRNPWDHLKEALSDFDGEEIPVWTGFLSYEMGAYSDLDATLPVEGIEIPFCYFQRCSLILRMSHQTGEVWVYSDGIDAKYTKEEFWDKLTIGKPVEPGRSRVVKPLERVEEYQNKILKAKELIYEGEIYQVNLSQQTLIETECKPFSIFSRLARENPAPFSAYFHVGPYTIISSSPERLLRKSGERLETRPIKGTAPRGKNLEEDVRMRSQLMQSAKDRAELLMITDLMRNDLGRASRPGSVQVKELYRCEEYANVFHLLSIIESNALPGLHPVDVLRVCFPGGSITGCPKIRSMEVIHQLEKRARGIYTGSIGYFAGNGDFDFNIAIRTLLYRDRMLDVQLGGAIVADSDPVKEYQETLHKGESIFLTLNL